MSLATFLNTSYCLECNFLPRTTVLARDSMVYFVIVFGLWMITIANQWLLTTGNLCFIACIVLLLVYDLIPAMNVDFRVWVDLPLSWKPGLIVSFSACQCVVSVAVRYTFFHGRDFDTDMTMVPGWAHDDEHSWTEARQSRIYCSTADRKNCHTRQCSLETGESQLRRKV